LPLWAGINVGRGSTPPAEESTDFFSQIVIKWWWWCWCGAGVVLVVVEEPYKRF
jgi:hypothetical protein